MDILHGQAKWLTKPSRATAFSLRLRLHYKAARVGGVRQEQEATLNRGTSHKSHVNFGEYTYDGPVDCHLNIRSGLSLSWGDRRGLSIMPFTSFMITNVTDAQIFEGVSYKLQGTTVGLYHQTIDPREPPLNNKLLSINLEIVYHKEGVKMNINADTDAGFVITVNLFLPTNELYSLVDMCNEIFSDRLREHANA